MKNISLLLPCIFMCLLLISSCSDDDDDQTSPTPANKPSDNCSELDVLINNFGDKTLYMTSNLQIEAGNPAPNPFNGICLLDDTIKIVLGSFGDNNHQFNRNNLQLCDWNEVSGVFSFAECRSGVLQVSRGPNAYYTISSLTDTSMQISYLDTIQNEPYNFIEAWEVLK